MPLWPDHVVSTLGANNLLDPPAEIIIYLAKLLVQLVVYPVQLVLYHMILYAICAGRSLGGDRRAKQRGDGEIVKALSHRQYKLN